MSERVGQSLVVATDSRELGSVASAHSKCWLVLQSYSMPHCCCCCNYHEPACKLSHKQEPLTRLAAMQQQRAADPTAAIHAALVRERESEEREESEERREASTRRAITIKVPPEPWRKNKGARERSDALRCNLSYAPSLAPSRSLSLPRYRLSLTRTLSRTRSPDRCRNRADCTLVDHALERAPEPCSKYLPFGHTLVPLLRDLTSLCAAAIEHRQLHHHRQHVVPQIEEVVQEGQGQ